MKTNPGLSDLFRFFIADFQPNPQTVEGIDQVEGILDHHHHPGRIRFPGEEQVGEEDDVADIGQVPQIPLLHVGQ